MYNMYNMYNNIWCAKFHCIAHATVFNTPPLPPGLQSALGEMYNVIDTRLAQLPSLLALSGRVNLLLAQLPQQLGGEAEDGAQAQTLLQPQVTLSACLCR